MAKTPPGESGGRRRIGRDKGSPVVGDGKKQGRKIKGHEVEFRSAGGHTDSTGSAFSRALRWIGGGRHRGGK